MQWRRACENSACVEVARLDDGAVLIRDSKDPDTVVVFSADAWSAFTAGVRAGKFDR